MGHQFLESEPGDLRLLSRRDPQLRGRIVPETAAQLAEQLASGLSRGARQEQVPKALDVGDVLTGEGRARRGCGRVHASLFAAGPLLGRAFADARVVLKRLQPVLPPQRPPGALGVGQQRGVARERAGGE